MVLSFFLHFVHFLKGITTDEVYGLALSDAGELVLDTDNFYAVNMMKKIHTNTLIPMVEEDCLANLFYIVIGTHKVKQETMYDVISSRYERTSFLEEKVKAFQIPFSAYYLSNLVYRFKYLFFIFNGFSNKIFVKSKLFEKVGFDE